ncbi:MAG: AAA family ATPase [Asticcacaulis sp.]
MEVDHPSIVLLSGPVGAGKTTIAQALVTNTSHPCILIEGDTFWSFIAHPSLDQPPHKRFMMTMRAMIAAAVPYASSKYEVIVDFSIPPWFLDTAKAIATFKGADLHYIVLLPPEEVCADRAAARLEGTIADYSTYRDLYADFTKAGPAHTLEPDATDPAEIARLIRQGLTSGRFRVAG